MTLDNTTLQKLHSVEVEILDEVVRVCDKHGLQYFLIGGTLLGAIRHKGFIPWDDDIDIGMFRKDYEHFIKICTTELNDNFYLLCPETYPPYWSNFAKVCRANTLFFEKNTRNYQGVEHRGIYIDIFPFDYTLNIRFLQKIKRLVIDNLHALVQLKRGIEFPKSLFKPFRKFFSALFSFAVIHLLIKKAMMFGTGKSKYIISWAGLYGDENETVPFSSFFPLETAEFEGKLYSVPRQWDIYLSRLYGDYMQLPPEEKRKTHNPELVVFDTRKN